eukprot:TRINITY_DN195_c1_g4_i1.p1 TRINITY_DN195_c1_g4~~TRINITY_DN195_c1_g4_i1.p1  ORF type:complete len:436 (+),score=192.12 TRINITY_DN195_c1_g4_i1:49-1356(+)
MATQPKVTRPKVSQPKTQNNFSSSIINSRKAKPSHNNNNNSNNNNINANLNDENIFSKLWEIDQSSLGNGVVPILSTSNEVRPTSGYVIIDISSNGPDHVVIPEVVIPQNKLLTYKLVTDLFDNYVLNENVDDSFNEAQEEEISKFLDAIIKTEVIKTCKKYINQVTGKNYSNDNWKRNIYDIWFQFFSNKKRPTLSTFEHVFVGEKSKSSVGGQHFWYKYYYDDGKTGKEDTIKFKGYINPFGPLTPEVLTISYEWQVGTQLKKGTGGFWVGCSAEYIFAVGLILAESRFPTFTVINGHYYQIPSFFFESYMRTYYPILSDAETQAIRQQISTAIEPFILFKGDIRILSLTQPSDGYSYVQIINDSKKPINIQNWSISSDTEFSVITTDSTLINYLDVFTYSLSIQFPETDSYIYLLDDQQNEITKVYYANLIK